MSELTRVIDMRVLRTGYIQSETSEEYKIRWHGGEEEIVSRGYFARAQFKGGRRYRIAPIRSKAAKLSD